jgi:mannitol/fructose-specific phosphotransferase system IIA component (Ntr-type)
MSSSELFIHPTILQDLQADSTPDVFEEMVQFLVEKQLLPPDLQKNTLDALLAREEKLSTALGEGLAIPHASVPGLPGSLVILAKSQKGVSYKSPDNLPVFVFFLILVPSHDYGAHLRTLARVGKFLSRPGIKEKLRSIREPSDLIKLFETA